MMIHHHLPCSAAIAGIGSQRCFSMLQWVKGLRFRTWSTRKLLAEFTVNKYRPDRVLRFGPDLACLEWLMKCGSTGVLMSDNTLITSQRQMRQYLSRLGCDTSAKKMDSPTEEELKEFRSPKRIQSAVRNNAFYDHCWSSIPPVHIKEVDASDAALTDEGFQYFVECRNLERMKLNFCDYFGDGALRHLASGRPARTLQDLEICLNSYLSDGCTPYLGRLVSLKRLHLYFLPYVCNRQEVLRQLRISLPRCKVTFPKTEVMGFGYTVDQQAEQKWK